MEDITWELKFNTDNLDFHDIRKAVITAFGGQTAKAMNDNWEKEPILILPSDLREDEKKGLSLLCLQTYVGDWFDPEESWLVAVVLDKFLYEKLPKDSPIRDKVKRFEDACSDAYMQHRRLYFY